MRSIETFNVREWDRFLIPYEQGVQELKIKFKSLRNGFREIGEYSPIEFVTGRVKKVSSILEKSKRYEISYENIATEMEDIAGIRIMCQLLDDIYRVVGLIRERDGSDLEILYEKDYVHEFKESGYRSYHMVIRYPVHTSTGFHKILAEIQIRTLAMNFWATIEHSLNYKYKQNIPDSVKDRLQAAAKAVSELDNEMLMIKDDIISAQVLFEKKSNIIRIITDQLRLLHQLGKVDEASKLQEKFEHILDLSSNEELEVLLKEIQSYLPKDEEQ